MPFRAVLSRTSSLSRLVAQCDHGVDAGGAAGRQIAGEQAGGAKGANTNASGSNAETPHSRHLRVVFLIQPCTAEERQEPLKRRAQPVDHGSASSPDSASTRSITVEGLSQYAASSVSCLRPR
jgi:hypothetical protein